MSARDWARTTAQLREAFDASFAKPPVVGREAAEDVLSIRAHRTRLVVRARDIAGIMRCPPLAAVPSRNAPLCGLAGVRGALVAVYSLAALTGDGGAAGGGWIAMCAADRSAALQFDELLGYARVAADAFFAVASPGATGAPRTTEVVRIDGASCAVVNVSKLLNTIGRAAGAGTEE